MRFAALLLLSTLAAAQSTPRFHISHTTESLRGVSTVTRQIAWASGTHGTYLRTTDGGLTWYPAQVPDATNLDFRAVIAFSADEAFLMSAGPGDQSRIYHTIDAGQHWQLQFTNTNPKGFFDSMAFWDRTHGVVLGDPIPDESGKLKFELLETEDGQSWHQIPPAQLPEAVEGEGAFAASNSCIALLHSNTNSVIPSMSSALSNSPVILSGAVNRAQHDPLRSRRIPTNSSSLDAQQGILSAAQPAPLHAVTWQSGASPRQPAKEEGASAPDSNLWFATGGKTARVFHSPDRGKTWEVFDTPILHGPDSAGIFSIAFRDARHGFIAGGDYKHPKDDGPNLAFTNDGGKTWTLSELKPQAYFSAVAYDQKFNAAALNQQAEQAKQRSEGKKLRAQPVDPQRLFIIGQDFIFDFRPPNNPRRISGKKKIPLALNAVSPFPEGGALAAGPKGTILYVP
jgi:photosystem II stability/assembly factor-like uncharacterized protein